MFFYVCLGLNNMTKRQNILISWVGHTDLRASRGEAEGIGPVAQGVAHCGYDRVVLLYNYPEQEVTPYLSWITEKTPSPIEPHHIKLDRPTHFGQIYQAVCAHIQAILDTHGADTRLTYHLSPGTPAMAAVWIIVAKTRFAAELIESSLRYGVRTATVPFEISAEFIPELLKRPDRDLSRLTAGMVEAAPAFDAILHRGGAMKRVISKAQKVAPRSVPVLIEGESGTGKELLARAIHGASLRHDRPFIAVNCGAIAPELAESEFFGHKKGAFTGAAEARKGHFREADGGTLFLDEIGELPLGLQVKLLRALQEGQIVPVGGSKPVQVDVRIVSATNRRLNQEVIDGRFREDLFYRLAVAVIRLPPLRERRGDLGLLIDRLLRTINRDSAAEPAWEDKKLSAGARNLLLDYAWPGNVRELQNTLTRAVVWSDERIIRKEDVRDALLDSPSHNADGEGILDLPLEEGLDLRTILSTVARHYLVRARAEAHGNKSRAAQLLGLSNYQTFDNWMKKYQTNE